MKRFFGTSSTTLMVLRVSTLLAGRQHHNSTCATAQQRWGPKPLEKKWFRAGKQEQLQLRNCTTTKKHYKNKGFAKNAHYNFAPCFSASAFFWLLCQGKCALTVRPRNQAFASPKLHHQQKHYKNRGPASGFRSKAGDHPKTL